MDLEKAREILDIDQEFGFEEKIEDLLKFCEAIWIYQGKRKEPHALLASGKHSDGYINLNALLQFPNLCKFLAEKLVLKLKDLIEIEKIEVVASPSFAAITFGYEVARQLKTIFVFTEKKDNNQKWSGRFEIPKKAKILQVEELITTLKTAYQVKETILEANPEIEFLETKEGKTVVATVIYRPQDLFFKDPKYEVISLFSKEIHSWQPDECPLCKKGSPVLKPKPNWKKFLEYL